MGVKGKQNLRKLLSIIVPIYNTSKYLEKCILSIISQTYSNLEIVLVNDGSTDDSLEICRRYAATDPRIVVINKANGGLVSARKAGLNIAKGEMIGFVDSDDYISKDMYEKIITAKIQTNSDFVYAGLHNCYDSAEGLIITEDNSPRVSGIFNLEDTLVDFLKNYVFTLDLNSQIYTGGICLGIFEKESIKEAYRHVPDDCSQGEDFICQMWLLIASKRVYFSNEVLYHYRVHNESISHKTDLMKFEQINRMMLEITNICKINGIYKELDENLCLYNRLLLLLEKIKGNISLREELYHFPSECKLENKKVIIYAAGTVGWSYYKQFSSNSRIKIVLHVDKNHNIEGIRPIDDIVDVDYDLIVIAIDNERIARSIRTDLCIRGIDPNVILWEKPQININTIRKTELI